ncbi:hypothetical protein [Streptococcus pseudopneumoniae]|uniref:hypothetical protein n=1 Tax=Streptococcus pseudopneumoniae TaxID=257758 RepID=UPI00110C39DE|nr:hypothetical protein [Streptococcus pseudopneumoniae]TMR84129.1 hypothetical protein E3V42_05225 [Streptococcus pseudopneumoniae]
MENKKTKGAAKIRLFKISHAEYGKVLDVLDAKTSILDVRNMISNREPDYEYFIPKVIFSLDKEAKENGFYCSGLNGDFAYLPRVTTDIVEFELPDELKEHIAKGYPLFYTKWR